MTLRYFIRRFLRFMLIMLTVLLLLSVFLVVIYKWVPVWVTPLMVQQSIVHAKDPDYHTLSTWKSLEHISPEMAKAVIASEDQKFLDHDGFDREEIRNALEERRNGTRIRGASTISQQTAKNVFCTPARTYTRKLVEAYFTVLIELLWGKQRILEVYLNVIELGDGVFGVESAADEYFSTSALRLNSHQSAALTDIIPCPRCYTAWLYGIE